MLYKTQITKNVLILFNLLITYSMNWDHRLRDVFLITAEMIGRWLSKVPASQHEELNLHSHLGERGQD